MKPNIYLVICVLLFMTTSVFASKVDTLEASINVEFMSDRIMFKPELPELAGIPGGRDPFYTYLWDFGDGHFSTAEAPGHRYAKAGEYAVTLYAVNNYDNGPRPKRPTRKIKVDSAKAGSQQVASVAEQHFFNTDDTFKLIKNANALPGQDMVVVAGIKTTEKGSVFLLTNEKIFDPEGFRFAGQSTYYGEQVIPMEETQSLESLWANVSTASITRSGSPDYGMREKLNFSGDEAVDYFSELYSSYKTITGYEVDGASDAQFSLINLDITPEMLADTNATVTITGVFIPEKGPARIHQLDVPIVTSHDPNKMSIKQSQINYRTLAKRKKLTYKVQFQNDGKGDAKNIRLEVKLPEVLDLSTIELLNLYPRCDTCLTPESTGCYYYEIKGSDTLVFHFKDIALPGSKAPDVHDKDSTQGFIRFSIRPEKNLPNRPFKAQTNIFFDKNDPITTNVATGRFRKSLSPIVFAGYHHFLQAPEQWNNRQATMNPGMLFGVGLAPLAPYRKLYWQVELYANTYQATSNVQGIKESGEMEVPIPGTDRPQIRSYTSYDQYMNSRFLQLRIVPLQARYNFNSWVSAGIGAMVETSINTSHRETRTYHIPFDPDELLIAQPYTSERLERGRLQLQPFIDLNVGRTYLGPVAGLRYIYGNKSGQATHLYVAWRF
ncbi:PKD domain-containing protein [Parapedobacter sp. 10938]|uniref:PKD domain-containing protein n=1 Tax=Parapedobacter flavus TaxID=3110225 RepID=UPI002DBE142F|nr:PKD domain-containing protein [Parapedobacter sp. 10938]MEC3879622.1 PKD domain-containing protein [Parapedobacter sp. 10938]